jgi:elongation factor P
MYTSSNFRKGLPILVEGEPYYVVSYLHIKMGRGGANVRTKLKHIISGAVVEKVFSPDESFKPPDLERRKMQYMYESGDELAFMDAQTFDQYSIPAEDLGDARMYLLENQEYTMLFLNNKAISVDLPASVILEVIETEPSVRGDTVSNVTKPAKMQTGLEVKVPPFVKLGDRLKIDTRTGEYLERAN